VLYLNDNLQVFVISGKRVIFIQKTLPHSPLCILDLKCSFDISLTYHFELLCNLLSPFDIVIGTVLWTAEVCFVEWLDQVSLQHLFKIRISFIEWKRDWFVDQLCAKCICNVDSFGSGCRQSLLIKQGSKFVWWTHSATTLSWEVFCQYVFSLFKPWMG
jgi:hypothetical protein